MSENNLINTFTSGRGRLRALARRFLNAESDVDDVLQEAFVRLWPGSHRLTGQKHSDAAAAMTVRNIAIDRIRRQTVRCEDCSVDSIKSVADETDADQQETLEDVRTIIEQHLSPVQRDIIRMREYEGMEFEEIAAALDMQPPAVRMQLSRARKKIREIYIKRQS